MKLDSPNQHCLDNIVRLSERRTVSAADDIYDDRGFKLWAKGKPVSAEMHEKLLRRTLAKPLETSLTVERAVGFAEVTADCLRCCEEQPLLGAIAGCKAASELLAEAAKLEVPAPLRLLLTSIKENDAGSYAHLVEVVLISAGIAARVGTSVDDARSLLMAALLHDVGEMYINPEYLHATRRLAPHEWKHVVAHPRIGQLLVDELTSLPAEIGRCVAQHHERNNGSGYPAQLRQDKLHRLAGIIAVADSTAALNARGGKGSAARIALALRIVPYEYDRDAVSAVLQSLRDVDREYGVEEGCDCAARAAETMRQLEAVRYSAAALAEGTTRLERLIGAAVADALGDIARSLHGTGVLDAGMLGDAIDDPQLKAEMCLTVREIQWRLRNLGRNIYLRAEAESDAAAVDAVRKLVELLDG